jgi:hypothetical protein
MPWRRLRAIVVSVTEVIDRRLHGRVRLLRACAFSESLRAGRNVVENPVPERALRRVGILHDQGIASRARWRTVPLDRGRDIPSSATVTVGDPFAGGESGAAQCQRHGYLRKHVGLEMGSRSPGVTSSNRSTHVLGGHAGCLPTI